MTTINKAMSNFFGVEIRNEQHGGVSPATLGSANDSLLQAPTDVIDEWAGEKNAHLFIFNELDELIEKFGDDYKLSHF